MYEYYDRDHNKANGNDLTEALSKVQLPLTNAAISVLLVRLFLTGVISHYYFTRGSAVSVFSCLVGCFLFPV